MKQCHIHKLGASGIDSDVVARSCNNGLLPYAFPKYLYLICYDSNTSHL